MGEWSVWGVKIYVAVTLELMRSSKDYGMRTVDWMTDDWFLNVWSTEGITGSDVSTSYRPWPSVSISLLFHVSDYGEVEAYLMSALREGEWAASWSHLLTDKRMTIIIHSLGRRVGEGASPIYVKRNWLRSAGIGTVNPYLSAQYTNWSFSVPSSGGCASVL
jgi:hypothetical protein